jgi:hypothetical protein
MCRISQANLKTETQKERSERMKKVKAERKPDLRGPVVQARTIKEGTSGKGPVLSTIAVLFDTEGKPLQKITRHIHLCPQCSTTVTYRPLGPRG